LSRKKANKTNSFQSLFSTPLPLPPPHFYVTVLQVHAKKCFKHVFKQNETDCLPYWIEFYLYIFSAGILPHLSVEAFAAAAAVEYLAVLVARGMPQQIV
jgi:hypothetical protein